ncbi:uncharacterized protein Z518_08975 [Rhinocladiella mackenziei CBS 650.93]|uniref:Autophagy-related protein n=1 Tax=Rhinocladiella mackenziei CBS 650.93 TaxID=1442369 RepID=A0A0D2IXB8_9EURO|nr:uncharacterized protein Z518_08975 [Rhinocladiella mackenziei CBS 650.93]KIX01250.1 hypothetical protein Z518_08975 [Rhinocladiella mackenziei CBS 650.93]
MSVFGLIANSLGAVVTIVIVIILSATLSGGSAQTAGLLVTTVVGFITVAGSIVAFLGLPAVPSKPTSNLKGSWSRPILDFFIPFKDLLLRKNMLALLVSYTIYTDSTFTLISIVGQLFVAEVHPSTLEYSLYSLSQSLLSIGCTVAFFVIRPYIRIKLETWLIMGYALILLIPAWGCIGLSSVDFGFKNRWEFYVQLFVISLSGSFVNASFRVLFSELIPKGSEVEWFGLQLILSCATVWINYVASGPLQSATHPLRFPLVLGLVPACCGDLSRSTFELPKPSSLDPVWGEASFARLFDL